MMSIKGAWLWNDILTSPCPAQQVKFYANTMAFQYIDHHAISGEFSFAYMSYSVTQEIIDAITVYGSHDIDDGIGKWFTQNYRIIYFGENSQDVSDDFYAYLLANAVQLMTISIDSGAGIMLTTQKKYCDGNIYVVPILEECEATHNGIISPDFGYAGLSRVRVNVPPPEGYIVPSGQINITANGIYDVTEFVEVNIAVPVPDDYIKPSGEITITSNGLYTVTEKAIARVNVPQGVFTMPLTVIASDVQTSCDGFWVMGERKASELADDFLDSVDHMVVDHNGICPCIAFYGWTNTGSDNIIAFGYEINGKQVWNATKMQTYTVDNGAGGTINLTTDNTINNIAPDSGLSAYFPHAKRHLIEVDLRGLSAGLYNITPLIKTTDEILGLNKWDTVRYVKWVD